MADPGFVQSPEHAGRALTIVRFLALWFTFLVAGTFFGTWVTFARANDELSASVYTEVQQATLDAIVKVLPILTPAAGLAILVALILMRHERRSRRFQLTAAAFALYLAALVVTVWIDIPITSEVNDWSVGSPPADWEDTRDRWDSGHLARMIFAQGSMLCLFASTLVKQTTSATTSPSGR